MIWFILSLKFEIHIASLLLIKTIITQDSCLCPKPHVGQVYQVLPCPHWFCAGSSKVQILMSCSHMKSIFWFICNLLSEDSFFLFRKRRKNMIKNEKCYCTFAFRSSATGPGGWEGGEGAAQSEPLHCDPQRGSWEHTHRGRSTFLSHTVHAAY